MISIGIIECIDVELVLHSISTGTLNNIGGVGLVIPLSIWDSINGTHLDLTTMVGVVHTMDITMVGIYTITMVGVLIIGDREIHGIHTLGIIETI
jgi:hypothetical protein